MDFEQTANTAFYWGSATSAFQIEGSPLADGAVESDWLRLTRTGKVEGGDTADIAADHYRRWREDIEIMRSIGLGAYRFSVAWPRIVPAPGKVNPAGLDFYDQLVDGLLAAGITPFVTLFHWDVPGWLDNCGGWLANNAPARFQEYSRLVIERLGDRVSHWITLNEPHVYHHSYITGWHWPFKENSFADLVLAQHQLLEAHQKVLTEYRRSGAAGEMGITLSYHILDPEKQTAADIAAVRRAEGVIDRWFLDRVMKGTYPEDMLELYADILPEGCREPVDADLFEKPDFLGVNYYAKGKIRHDPAVERYEYSAPVDEFELQPTISSNPQGLVEMASRIQDDYGPVDMFITENGFLDYECDDVDTMLHDRKRVDYLLDHLEAVKKCLELGLPLRGYFYWSLLDNFEWRWGLGRRYGLVHVDRKTQDRTLKDSAHFYRKYITEHAEVFQKILRSNSETPICSR